MTPGEPIVVARGLRKRFRAGGGDVSAVDGVDLVLRGGDFVAVQGRSGSGKTTLLSMCGALQRPDAGHLTVNGQDPYALGPGRRATFRAREIGFVFQQFHLIPYLSVRDNVLSARLAWKQDSDHARAHELMERFGLQDRAKHRPGQLSTGERQRVALARALLHRPRLILADEPTGNLDSENAEIVLRALSELASEGAAVLMVTHDDRLANRAGRVMHMEHGAWREPSHGQ
jgi:putative ABC transport system ATP-binding protein